MRFLHTMLRVFDLDKSLRFYCEVLDFELRRRSDHNKDRLTLVFLAPPGTPPEGPELELAHHWDRDTPYERGNGYGHLALGVDSLDAITERLQAHALTFSWGPGKGPAGDTRVAMLKDPDGYEIELLER